MKNRVSKHLAAVDEQAKTKAHMRWFAALAVVFDKCADWSEHNTSDEWSEVVGAVVEFKEAEEDRIRFGIEIEETELTFETRRLLLVLRHLYSGVETKDFVKIAAGFDGLCAVVFGSSRNK